MTTEPMTLEQLLGHLQAIIRDTEALLRATASYAGESVQETRSKAEDSLAAARERLQGVESELLDKARDVLGSSRSYVRENPWRAIGVAAAVGFLLGSLASRQRS